MIGPLLKAAEWSPWTEMRELQRQMNRLLDRGYPYSVQFPAVNVWTTEEDVVLTAELPGVAAADLDIAVQGNTLTLKGSVNPETFKEEGTYHRKERQTGDFSRSWRLPFDVDRDKVEAKLEKGVLKLTLPRTEEDKPRKIKVKS